MIDKSKALLRIAGLLCARAFHQAVIANISVPGILLHISVSRTGKKNEIARAASLVIFSGFLLLLKMSELIQIVSFDFKTAYVRFISC